MERKTRAAVAQRSRISFGAAETGCGVIAGCLRNRAAVAAAAVHLGAAITVIASGERWPDGSMPPAYEDLIGAGAIIDAMAESNARLSPEAASARAAFLDAQDELDDRMSGVPSAVEPIQLGFEDDVKLACCHGVSSTVPVLRGRAYEGASSLEPRALVAGVVEDGRDRAAEPVGLRGRRSKPA